MKATILDQWTMELPEPSASPWFLDWVLRSPRQAGQHLACSYETFGSLAQVYDQTEFTAVKEYFGGIGAHALMLQDLLQPSDHAVSDASHAAVEHLQGTLPGSVRVQRADAYASGTPWMADLAVLDFGDLTVWKAQPGTPRGNLLDKVFSMKPLAVTVTDIAARYLHLQKKLYETVLGEGTCGSYESYLEAFSRQLEQRYGYVLLEGNYTRWSCVMAFVPAGLTSRGRFFPLPADAPGLVLK